MQREAIAREGQGSCASTFTSSSSKISSKLEIHGGTRSLLWSKGRTRDTGHSLTLRAVHGFLFLYSLALCYAALTTRAETCWFLPPPLQLYISLKTPRISSPLTKTPSCPKKLNPDPSVTKGEPCTACSNSPGLLCGSSTLVTPLLAQF